MANFICRNQGIFITLTTLLAIELLAETVVRIPNPPPILMLTIVFAAFIGGMRQGLISAAATWLYTLYHFSIPGQLFHYTTESLQRIIVLTPVIPATAVIVGILKNRADRAFELEKRNAVIQAEIEEHKKNEEYNRYLFESSPIGLALCRMDGSLVDVNKAYAKIIGRTVEETLKLTYWDITPEKYAEQEQAQITAIQTTGQYGPYEKEYIHKDGRLVPVRLHGLIIQKNGDDFIWSSVEDISGQKEAEKKLFEVFKRIMDGFVALDKYWRYVYINNKGAELFGRRPEDLIGKHIWTEFPEGVDQPFAKAYRKAMDEQIFIRIEDYYAPWDRWFENRIYPSPDGISIFYTEITERKKAAEALQRNEQVLRLFVEHSPAAIAMFDRDMKYIVASRRFLMDYDLGNQNLTGRSHYDVFPEMPGRWKEIHRRCLAGAIEKSEEDPFMRADGEMDWVRWEIHPWYETGGEIGGIILFSEVITERKKAEEELQITNEELLSINRIITTTTTTTAGVKEILEKVLDEALNITGLEGGTICLVTPDETLHLAAHRETSEETILDLTTNTVKVGDCLCGECARDHKPLILRNRDEVLEFATREATRGEDIRFHAAFPLIISERCLGVLCVFTRTDKKTADRSLKLLETVTAQIAISLDNAQMFEKISHYAVTLEDKVRERTADLKESQTALMSIVEDLNTKTEELKAANEKLKELDRLKSMFIASMSHELRTPLNSVIGFSSIMLNEWSGPLNDEQKNNLSSILKSGKHLLALINDVIDVSKIEAGMVEPFIEDFDLNDVINEAVDTIKKDAEAKKLELKVDSIHQMIHTDRRRLFQCVLNLLSNAVKFTEKGSVSMQARLGVRDWGFGIGEKEPTPKPQQPNPNRDFVEISVEDTGIGIKEEDMPKLFKSFVRLDSPLRSTVLGTGLGLYLTKKLLTEILKGEIIIESRYGEASTFTIKIPIGIQNE